VIIHPPLEVGWEAPRTDHPSPRSLPIERDRDCRDLIPTSLSFELSDLGV